MLPRLNSADPVRLSEFVEVGRLNHYEHVKWSIVTARIEKIIEIKKRKEKILGLRTLHEV